jgi:hypothetical protein
MYDMVGEGVHGTSKVERRGSVAPERLRNTVLKYDSHTAPDG